MPKSTPTTARVAVSVMFGINGFITGAWAPQIPLLLPRHQIDEATLGLLILGLGLGAVGAMLFAGRLISQHGSVKMLGILAACCMMGLPLVIAAPNLVLLAMAMVLLGALLGSMDVAMNANTVELESQSGRAIMSSCHGFWSLGGFLGAGLGALLAAKWGALPQALVVSTIGLILALGAVRYLSGTKPLPQAHRTKAKGDFLPRHGGLWLLGVLALFSMIPEGAVLDWAALYLQQEMGSDLFRAGLAFAAFSATMAIMRFAGDGLRNRFGAVKTLRVSGLLAAFGMVLAAISPVDSLAILAFALTGLGVANMVPIMFSAAGHFPGLPAATALSVVTMVGYSGILVAPASIGVIASHIGFRWTYAILALLLVLVASLAARVAGADTLRDHH